MAFEPLFQNSLEIKVQGNIKPWTPWTRTNHSSPPALGEEREQAPAGPPTKEGPGALMFLWGFRRIGDLAGMHAWESPARFNVKLVKTMTLH